MANILSHFNMAAFGEIISGQGLYDLREHTLTRWILELIRHYEMWDICRLLIQKVRNKNIAVDLEARTTGLFL